LGTWRHRLCDAVSGFVFAPVEPAVSTFPDVAQTPAREEAVGRQDTVGRLDVGLAVDAQLGDQQA